MEDQTNQEWLNSLNVGDTVAIDERRYGSQHWTIRRITRITAKRIEVGDSKFNREDGKEVGGDKWYPKRLQPITTEIRESIETRKLWAALENAVQDKSLSLEQLRAIKEIISPTN